MSQLQTFLRQSFKFATATVFAQAIGTVTSILTRRYLTPEMMGIWTSCTVILGYVMFSDLGLFAALEVKIPYLRGRQEDKEISDMRNTGFTCAVIISLSLSIVSFVFLYLARHALSWYMVFGIGMISLIASASFFYNLFIVMLRADKDFYLLSKSIVFNSLMMFVNIAVWVYFFKLKGIFFATLLATFLSVWYVVSKTKYRLRFHFDFRRIINLVKVGFPLVIVGTSYAFFISIDKLAIMKMLGARELGFYSIAILSFGYALTFPKLLGIMIFPSMQEEHGRNLSQEKTLRYVKQPAFAMAYLFPVFLAFAYFAIPVLVRYVIPRYTPGVSSMKILIWGCFFMSLSNLAQNFIITRNKQLVLVLFLALSIAVGMVLNFIIIKAGYGINGVALATSFAYFIYFCLVYGYAMQSCESFLALVRFIFTLCLPLFYAVIILVILEYFLPKRHLVYNIMIQAVIFYVGYAPFLFYVQKKTMIISNLILTVKNKVMTLCPKRLKHA